MKIYLQLILFFFLGNTILLAQSDVIWGDYERKALGNNTRYDFLGIVGDHYFVLAGIPNKKLLQKYSLDHRLIKEKEIRDFGKNRDFIIQNIIKTPKDTFLFAYEYIDKHREWVLYKYDYQDGFFGKPIELHYDSYKDLSRKRVLSSFNSYRNDETNGGAYISPDSNYIAFVNIIEPTDYRQKDVISLSVYDSKMRKEWFISYDYKFSREGFTLEDILLSDEGKIYILGAENRKNKVGGKVKSIKVKNLPRYDYYVYRVDQNAIEEYKVETSDGTGVVEAGFFISKDRPDQISISGFYTDGQKRNELDGVFLTNISTNLETQSQELNDFSEDVKKLIPNNVEIKDWLRFDDGTIAFIAEDSYVRQTNDFNDINRINTFSNRFNPAFNNRIDIYNTHDLIVVSFAPDYTLNQLQIIPRRFQDRMESLTSFRVLRGNKRQAIVFNDNKTRKEAKLLDRKGNIFTDIVYFDSSGRVDFQETLFTDREVDAIFPLRLIDTDQSKVIFGIYDNRDVSFGSILLD